MRYVHSAPPPYEPDLAEDIRRLLADLDRRLRHAGIPTSGECTPPLDVFETEGTVELCLDVPGVDVASLRIVSKRDVVIVVGAKTTAVSVALPATFHLIEREYGRFVRAVRLHAAVDLGRARAVLADGELRVTLPRLEERRGQERQIPIDVVPPGAAR